MSICRIILVQPPQAETRNESNPIGCFEVSLVGAVAR